MIAGFALVLHRGLTANFALTVTVYLQNVQSISIVMWTDSDDTVTLYCLVQSYSLVNKPLFNTVEGVVGLYLKS